MSEAGYEGVFKQKTRQSMGLAGKVDGCALFWRRSKFHLVESYSIEVGTNSAIEKNYAFSVVIVCMDEKGKSLFLTRTHKIPSLSTISLTKLHNVRQHRFWESILDRKRVLPF